MATQKRPYPKRPKREIDDPWRKRVLDALADRENPKERNIEWLAGAVGADAGGLRRAILKVGIPKGKPVQNTTAYKEPIEAVLGLDPSGPSTEEERLLLSGFRELSDEKKRALLALVDGAS